MGLNKPDLMKRAFWLYDLGVACALKDKRF